MYSTMIAPFCTDTPNNARNPTLKCVPVAYKANNPLTACCEGQAVGTLLTLPEGGKQSQRN
jgi:hypothetical protein